MTGPVFASAQLTGVLEEDRAGLARVAKANAEAIGYEVVRITYAFEEFTSEDLLQAIMDAITAGLGKLGKRLSKAFASNPVAFLSSAPAEVQDAIEATIGSELSKVFAKQGASFMEQAIADEAAGVSFEVSFNTPNAEALRYLEAQGGELIKGITGDALDNVRMALGEGVRLGLPYKETAKTIENIVGLSPRDVRSLMKRRTSLKSSGLTSSRVEAELSKHADRLVARRAQAIARTETIRANVYGRQVLWENAVKEGNLDATAKRQWITGSVGVCEFCLRMAGKTAHLGFPYMTPNGSMMGPPAHTNCRCAEALVIARR